MPAIASLEDLKAAQKDLLEAKDLNELKAKFKSTSLSWRLESQNKESIWKTSIASIRLYRNFGKIKR